MRGVSSQGQEVPAGEKPVPLWDLPTRLFHWLLVLLFPLAWWTASESHYRWHERIGLFLIGLLLFRLLWGFWGSQASRFASFLRGPGAVLRYLRGGGSDAGSSPPLPQANGHNPLGGWYIALVLLLLLLQALSGLFNSDDILFDGPLHHLASNEWQDRFGLMHEWLFDAVLVLAGLHILAVAYHQFARREPLLQAMVRGAAPGRTGERAPVSLWRAVLFAGLTGLLIWGVLALVPPPVSPW